MSYLSELRVNWRYVTAAAVGMACGYSFNLYLSSLFAPHLLQQFGWTKSEFALIGLSILSGAFFMPVAGWITDRVGTRRAATIGVVASPLILVAMATMSGSFTWFLILNMLQLMLVGSFTTVMVYNRLVAEQFVRTRGLALAITACTPAITAAAAAPLLTGFIDEHGWRAGYFALAVAVAVSGAIALLLIPRDGAEGGAGAEPVKHDYPALMRNPSFRILCAHKLLCGVTLTVLTPQLKLILLDRHLASATASQLISVYALATIGGRFFGGLALDRFPAHLVGVVGVGMIPAIGFAIIGAGLANPMLLAGTVLILGLAFGADGNITAYLIMRHFRFQIFSSVYSLISVAIAISAASGALLASITIKSSGGFGLFFMIAAGSFLVGGLLLGLLGRQPTVAATMHDYQGGEPLLAEG